MAIYKSFWSVRHKALNSKITWKARTIDITRVESWEYHDDETTKVCMKSGDRFLIRYETEEFADLVCAFVDGYGKLFTFNRN